MIKKLKQCENLLTIIIATVCSMSMLNNVYAQEPNSTLEWSIKTSKNAFYPGEPVLLTLNISNTGAQEEKVNFGADGIEAFSMEIRDSNNIIVSKGDKIQGKGGLSRIGTQKVSSGETVSKMIVLNRWSSTLLSPGQYQVICNIEYRLRSESQKKDNTKVFKAGPIHKTQLALKIQIIEIDKTKFKEILEALTGFEVKPPQRNSDWFIKRETAREMIALTESELAVPYQLQLLRSDSHTWFGPDTVNSLAKSGTLDAANGLVQMIKDPSINDDMKPIFIDGVYRLREKGKAEIINATEDFVSKYKRPVLSAPVD